MSEKKEETKKSGIGGLIIGFIFGFLIPVVTTMIHNNDPNNWGHATYGEIGFVLSIVLGCLVGIFGMLIQKNI